MATQTTPRESTTETGATGHLPQVTERRVEPMPLDMDWLRSVQANTSFAEKGPPSRVAAARGDLYRPDDPFGRRHRAPG